MNIGDKVVKAIYHVEEINQDFGGRRHLGASVLGQECLRQVWYGWRWAHISKHTGRILRLFRRGHNEEEQVVRALRETGLLVHDRDPVTREQFRFEDHDRHFGGSSDSVIMPNREFFGDDDPRLLEVKTHNLKSFSDLKAKKVQKSKPQHFHQMQIYMHYLKLPRALYLSVCKDNDELYAEEVIYRESLALLMVDRARDIIYTSRPPPRISQDPSWFKCRFCDFREICHYEAPPHKNCRSCIYARPIADGGWKCERFDAILPEEFIPKGCDHWEPIT